MPFKGRLKNFQRPPSGPFKGLAKDPSGITKDLRDLSSTQTSAKIALSRFPSTLLPAILKGGALVKLQGPHKSNEDKKKAKGNSRNAKESIGKPRGVRKAVILQGLPHPPNLSHLRKSP